MLKEKRRLLFGALKLNKLPFKYYLITFFLLYQPFLVNAQMYRGSNRSELLHGIVDKKGKIVVKAEYHSIQLLFKEAKYYVVTIDNKSGLIDRKGREIIPLEEDNSIKGISKERLIKGKFPNFHLMTVKGKILATFSNYIKDFWHGKYIIMEKGKKWGMSDFDGNAFLPFEYEGYNKVRDKKIAHYVLYDQDGMKRTTLVKIPNPGNPESEIHKIFTTTLNQEVIRIAGTKLFKTYIKHPRDNNRKLGLMNIININSDTISPMAWNKVKPLTSTLLFVEKNWKRGIIDSNGKIIVPAEYDMIKMMNHKTVQLFQERCFGIIDTFGNFLMPLEYDEVKRIYGGVNMLALKKNKSWYLMSLETHKVSSRPFDNYHTIPNSIKFIQVVIDKKIGLFSLDKMKLITEPVYQDTISQNLSHQYKGFIPLMKEDKWVLIDTAGLESSLVPKDTQFDYVGRHNRFREVSKDGKWGYCDPKGKVILPMIYDRIYPMIDGMGIVIKDKKFGLVDSNGTTILDCKYKNISWFQFGPSRPPMKIFSVQKEDKFAVANRNGLITDFEFDYCMISSIDIAIIGKDGLYSAINAKGKLLIPIKFQQLQLTDWDYNEGRSQTYAKKVLVIENAYVGLIDTSGKVIIQVENEFLQHLNGNQFMVTKNGKNSLIDIDGKILVRALKKGAVWSTRSGIAFYSIFRDPQEEVLRGKWVGVWKDKRLEFTIGYNANVHIVWGDSVIASQDFMRLNRAQIKIDCSLNPVHLDVSLNAREALGKWVKKAKIQGIVKVNNQGQLLLAWNLENQNLKRPIKFTLDNLIVLKRAL